MADLRIGGMALRDGVLLQSQDNWAAAVRLPDGGVELRSGVRSRLPFHGVFERVPVVRGVGRLVETVSALPAMRRGLGRRVLPQEEPAMFAAALASAVATIALRKTMKSAPLARELAISVLSVAPALLAVRMTELSRFHGAEHKSVAAFETGGDPETAAKEHDRCGTNLLGPLLLTNLAGGLVLRATGRDDKPLPTCCAPPALRCNACSRLASRPASSSTSPRRRSVNCCGSRASRRRRPRAPSRS